MILYFGKKNPALISLTIGKAYRWMVMGMVRRRTAVSASAWRFSTDHARFAQKSALADRTIVGPQWVDSGRSPRGDEPCDFIH
jgi:hypothetical protein